MAKKREHKFLSFVAIVIILVFAGAIFMVVSSGNPYKDTSSNQQSSNQTYKSKAMKFSINVPSKFHTLDQEDKTTLSDTNGNQINIIRNGTQFKNLSDYITNFDERRKLTPTETRKLSIDGNEAMSRIATFPEENVTYKSYYIYAYNWVYVISTSSEELFGDLDKIAQSFKYTP